MKKGFEKFLKCKRCNGPVFLDNVNVSKNNNRIEKADIFCKDHGIVFNVVDTIIVEKVSLNKALKDVQNFWNNHPCMVSGMMKNNLMMFIIIVMKQTRGLKSI